MPPYLALLICTLFVLFMLRLERKQSPDVSFALWIPTLWMLLISSKPLGIWFGTGGVDMEAGSALDRVFLTVLLCIGFLILFKRHFSWSIAIRQNIWVFILIGYMLVSIIWSDIPFLSFKRWVRNGLVAVVMAFLVASESNPRTAFESLFRRTVYVLIPFSFVLINYFPKYGREYGHWSGTLLWIGVAQQKNDLGLLCLFTAFFLIWTFISRRQRKVTSITWYQILSEANVLILSLWLLGGQQHTIKYSATATVTFASGLLAFIGLSLKKKTGTIPGANILRILVLFIFIYGTVTPMFGRLSLIDISSKLGRDETLTGRTEVWKQLVPVAMSRPLVGFAFGGFWTTRNREVYDISGAHSGYLEVFLDLGFLGIILYIIFFSTSISKAQKLMNEDYDWGALWICFLLMALVHNIAESSLSTLSYTMMAVILFLTVSYSKVTSNTPSVSINDN